MYGNSRHGFIPSAVQNNDKFMLQKQAIISCTQVRTGGRRHTFQELRCKPVPTFMEVKLLTSSRKRIRAGRSHPGCSHPTRS